MNSVRNVSRSVLLRAMLVVICVASGAAQAEGAAKSATPAPIIVETNVLVPMRDKVRLSTDIYRPRAPGRYPTILLRDPYSNGSGGLAKAQMLVDRGYVYVHQDVRGRYDSEGSFYPYAAEIGDGYDIVQWIASQPWSNGKVGMSGGSYMGSVQWLPAHLRPPALAAIIPSVAPFDYYKHAAYPGGAFSLAARVDWAVYMNGRTAQSGHDLQRIYRHLPLQTIDTAFGLDIPFLRDWIAHPSHDAYWHVYDVDSRAADIDVPALHVGGWYDAFLQGTLSSYTAISERGRTEAARKNQKLIVGPWNHFPDRDPAHDLDFGKDAKLDWSTIHARWFDHWLKGEDTGFLKEPPVRLFVMGENRWRAEQEWPLARARLTKYYLRSAGRANTVAGDGFLDLKKPGTSEPNDVYTYDPENPVPTRGGNLLPVTLGAGPRDQAEIAQRDDVLVFDTAPLDRDTEVTGPITVTLYAASSATDTDFTAKLIDVHPDGKAYNLADGIIRARYRQTLEEPRLIEPGQVYEYQIDLIATSNLFRKGHRIRVDISSSNFPRFDRNPNTGHKFGEDAQMQPATQTIYHTGRYPSHITLPVIPR